MANSKLTDFTEDTAPLATDMVYVVHDPAGTPGDRKVKLANVNRYKMVQAIQLNETGNLTSTSITFVAIDATKLPWSAAVALIVGEKVRCFIQGQCYDNVGQPYIDFAVDQPTSADTRIGGAAQRGLNWATNSGSRTTGSWTGIFTATEAGNHSFRPVWRGGGGTASLVFSNSATADAADNTGIAYTVERLGS